MKPVVLRASIALVLLCICLPAAASATRDSEEKARCTRLENRMDEIRLRRRMGYTAKQGRVSKQKLSALEAEYRARCRGVRARRSEEIQPNPDTGLVTRLRFGPPGLTGSASPVINAKPGQQESGRSCLDVVFTVRDLLLWG